MRISDWSSDVCSSDLSCTSMSVAASDRALASPTWRCSFTALARKKTSQAARLRRKRKIGRASCKGKSVSVRVDLGGRRIIKKKKKYDSTELYDNTIQTNNSHTTRTIYTEKTIQ